MSASSHRFLSELNSVDIHGVSIAPITEPECVRLIADEVDAGRGGWCVTVNLENLRKVTRNPSLRHLVTDSTLRVADGITLVWASCLQASPLPERVCGSNLIYSLTREMALRGQSAFFLGGNPGTAKAAADLLQRANPGLEVAGTFCPPMNFERDAEQIQYLQDILAEAQPEVIYVALGFPKSEQLIAQLRYICPRAWWIGVGISFSYVVGEVKRPPVWAQNLGLETPYRLIQEPRRLARRYLWDGPIFAVNLLSTALVRRFNPSMATMVKDNPSVKYLGEAFLAAPKDVNSGL
jgi:N-acetylglucosaminyldiphosphoundecaprenol N-acetyl-beta-D-mannosaminyltransferase